MSYGHGEASVAMLKLLRAGERGDYEYFARRAGLPSAKASMALRDLRRHGHIHVAKDGKEPPAGGIGRPRVVYELRRPEGSPAFNLHDVLRRAWR